MSLHLPLLGDIDNWLDSAVTQYLREEEEEEEERPVPRSLQAGALPLSPLSLAW